MREIFYIYAYRYHQPNTVVNKGLILLHLAVTAKASGCYTTGGYHVRRGDCPGFRTGRQVHPARRRIEPAIISADFVMFSGLNPTKRVKTSASVISATPSTPFRIKGAHAWSGSRSAWTSAAAGGISYHDACA